MTVEYWNKEKEQWLRSHSQTPESGREINDDVGWEMYREVE